MENLQRESEPFLVPRSRTGFAARYFTQDGEGSLVCLFVVEPVEDGED